MTDKHRLNVYLDIETIPAQNPKVLEEIKDEAERAKASIKPPSNYKDEAKIAEYVLTKQAEIDAETEVKWRKTSFDGASGQIVAISLAFDDEAPVNIYSENWASDEASLIKELYDLLRSAHNPVSERKPLFIGHNIVAFDLRFLLHRSMILGVRPPLFIPFFARAWDTTVYDTMVQWAGVGNRVSLDKLCRVFNVPTKGTEIGDEIDGSLVWDYVRDGRIRDVALYCGGDVERVRMIHRRMTFAPRDGSKEAEEELA